MRQLQSTGKKWELSTAEFYSRFEIIKINGEMQFGRLHLPNMLVIDVIIQNHEKTFVTCNGIDGLIGLSFHGDTWHLGTPHFATSHQLCKAMEFFDG